MSILPDVRHIRAAGGVLIRRQKNKVQLVLIFRRGVWDLPKGKLDPGESIPECALREVREELGISDGDELSIIKELSQTVHAYSVRNRYAVKTTHWFLMSSTADSFVPQKAEGIIKAEWRSFKKALGCVKFEPLSDLLRRHRTDILHAQPAAEDDSINGAA